MQHSLSPLNNIFEGTEREQQPEQRASFFFNALESQSHTDVIEPLICRQLLQVPSLVRERVRCDGQIVDATLPLT